MSMVTCVRQVVRPRDYVVHFPFVTKAFEDLTPPVLEVRDRF